MVTAPGEKDKGTGLTRAWLRLLDIALGDASLRGLVILAWATVVSCITAPWMKNPE